jgi:hypothetical protein
LAACIPKLAKLDSLATHRHAPPVLLALSGRQAYHPVLALRRLGLLENLVRHRDALLAGQFDFQLENLIDALLRMYVCSDLLPETIKRWAHESAFLNLAQVTSQLWVGWMLEAGGLLCLLLPVGMYVILESVLSSTPSSPLSTIPPNSQ